MEGRDQDEAAIGEVARAYLESWLDGDGERMRSALDPMLAKRGLDYGPGASPTGTPPPGHRLHDRQRGPRSRPQYGREIEVTILDLADNVASVKVVSEPFVDCLDLAKFEGRWWIVNVLYEDRQP